LQSFRTNISERRRLFLLLIGDIERQLRDAYDRKFRADEATQSSLAAKLGINRSAVHRRLTGRTNMTIETLADMVWALGQEISVNISDPVTVHGQNYIQASPLLSNIASGPSPAGTTQYATGIAAPGLPVGVIQAISTGGSQVSVASS
jgi:hypothetical protein